MLDEETTARRSPEVENERAIAIFDLIEENVFKPTGHEGGPYRLGLSLVDSKLVFDIRTEDGRNPAGGLRTATGRLRHFSRRSDA